jgi:hypothetical protein
LKIGQSELQKLTFKVSRLRIFSTFTRESFALTILVETQRSMLPYPFARFGCLLLLFFGIPAWAGTFFSDFNLGLPENAKTFGDAQHDGKRGAGGSGVLVLTRAQVNQMGSFVVEPLDGKKAAASFVANFKVFIGGGNSADGFAFHYASNIPNAAFADTAGSGLTIIFDTFKNGKQIAPGIRIHSSKAPHLETAASLRSDHFVEAMIKLDPDGTLDIMYDNDLIFTNVPTTATNIAGRFALSARTGSRTDNHLIDDLNIVTQTSPRAFVDTFGPVGNDVSPSVMVEIAIRDYKTAMKSGSVELKFDRAPVHPEISRGSEGTTLVRYEPPTLLEPGTAHSVAVQFVDTGTPPVTNKFSFGFRITSQVMLSK